MTKTTRCLLCVALICAIALLLPAVRAQAEGENPTYAYDSATKTLTITPGTSGLIGKEIQNESDYYPAFHAGTQASAAEGCSHTV